MRPPHELIDCSISTFMDDKGKTILAKDEHQAKARAGDETIVQEDAQVQEWIRDFLRHQHSGVKTMHTLRHPCRWCLGPPPPWCGPEIKQ